MLTEQGEGVLKIAAGLAFLSMDFRWLIVGGTYTKRPSRNVDFAAIEPLLICANQERFFALYMLQGAEVSTT